MLRSARGDWRTSAGELAVVRKVFGEIDLDPCGHPDAWGLAAHHIWIPDHLGDGWVIAGFEERLTIGDGLELPWAGRCFVNPDFGELAAWCAKCVAEAERGAEVILLFPSRTDTAYFHDHVSTAALICHWRGRLRFVGAAACAPFPVSFAYWGPRPAVFHAAFEPHGMVWTPTRPARAGRAA
jgi:hypothetical protein